MGCRFSSSSLDKKPGISLMQLDWSVFQNPSETPHRLGWDRKNEECPETRKRWYKTIVEYGGETRIIQQQFQVLFPAHGALDFQGFHFLYYYRTITAFFGFPAGGFFCVLVLLISSFFRNLVTRFFVSCRIPYDRFSGTCKPSGFGEGVERCVRLWELGLYAHGWRVVAVSPNIAMSHGLVVTFERQKWPAPVIAEAGTDFHILGAGAISRSRLYFVRSCEAIHGTAFLFMGLIM